MPINHFMVISGSHGERRGLIEARCKIICKFFMEGKGGALGGYGPGICLTF